VKLDLKSVFEVEGENLELSLSLDLSDLELLGTLPFPEPVEVRLRVANGAGIVSLSLDAVFLYRAPCDRCAAMAEKRMAIHADHTLVAQLQGAKDEEDEFLVVEDMRLDVDALATEEILLRLPSRFLCREDCRGLCPVCGVDLNTGECTCVGKTVDPRLEKLRDLLP